MIVQTDQHEKKVKRKYVRRPGSNPPGKPRELGQGPTKIQGVAVDRARAVEDEIERVKLGFKSISELYRHIRDLYFENKGRNYIGD